jgi:hypothetical protein
MHLDIVENRVDLRRNEVRRRQMHAENTLRVLRRQRSDDGHTVAAKRRECLEIGLNSGAAGWIGAGNRKNIGNIRRVNAGSSHRPFVGDHSAVIR